MTAHFQRADQLISDSMTHRQGAAAREDAEATLAAAKLQTEGVRQDLAASQAHLTQTRKELHASQGKVDQLEQQCQDLQDQTHQQIAEIKVCMTATLPDLVQNWSLKGVIIVSWHSKTSRTCCSAELGSR